MTNISYTHIILSKKVRIIGIRGIIHYLRQVCNLLFHMCHVDMMTEVIKLCYKQLDFVVSVIYEVSMHSSTVFSF